MYHVLWQMERTQKHATTVPLFFGNNTAGTGLTLFVSYGAQPTAMCSVYTFSTGGHDVDNVVMERCQCQQESCTRCWYCYGSLDVNHDEECMMA